MPTYREHEIRDGDQVVVEDAETVVTTETEVAPPVAPPVPPPPGMAPPGFVTSERVVVDDPEGTRVSTRDVRTPLPPDEDIPRWNWLTPALVFILLAALGIVLVAILLTNDDDNKSSSTPSTATATQPPANTALGVPTVVGQSRTGAEETLRSQGFTVVVATVPGPEPAGLVLAQNPPAGASASDGATVRINVSDGSQSVAGAQTQTQPPAQTQTAQAQTQPAQTQTSQGQTSQPTPSSSSSSDSGSGSSGSAQPAPTPVSVPAVSSGDMKSAVQSLSNAGLLASIQYVPSHETLGTVVSQSPSDGSSAKTGSHVTLSVSSGPGDKPQHSVPDASGQTIPQAVQTMNGAGLRLVMVKKTVTDQAQAGKVVEQTPKPGAQAPENAQIVVYMGAFKG